MALSDKQRGVLRGMMSAVVLVILIVGAAILFCPAALLPATGELAARPAWTGAWLLAPALCLLLAIGRLAGHRFHTPEDIDGSGLTAGSDAAHVKQAMIQNTLEQTVLAALVWFAYAALMPPEWLAAIPAAAVLFVIGRAFFVFGYSRGAPGRALGFALTFYSTALLAFITFVAAIGRLLNL